MRYPRARSYHSLYKVTRMFASTNLLKEINAALAVIESAIAANTSLIATNTNAIISNAGAISANAAAIAAKGFVNNLDINETAFATGDLTKDNAWHELDFSGKVPEGAKSIRIRITGMTTTDYGVSDFRVKGESYEHNIYRLWLQIADKRMDNVFDIPVAADRIIEYKLNTLTWTTCDIKVLGWHL